MRRLILLLIAAGILGYLFYPRAPRFEVTDELKAVLSATPGTVFLSFRTSDQRWGVEIVDGRVSPFAITSGGVGDGIGQVGQAMDLKVTDLPAPSEFEYSNTMLMSPDGRYTAVALIERGQAPTRGRYVAVIDNDSSKFVNIESTDEERFVDGFAWSPDSSYFAILRHSYQSGTSFKQIFSALSGHPWSYRRFEIEVKGSNGESVVRTVVAEDIESGVGRIEWK